MFPFHFLRLLCLACYWGWFCRFALVDSTIWLPYLLELFLLILVHVSTSVFLSNCTPASLHVIIVIIIIVVTIIAFSVADKNCPSANGAIYSYTTFIFNYTDIFSLGQYTETHFTLSANFICCGFNYSVNV
jgi:hypothetical protein